MSNLLRRILFALLAMIGCVIVSIFVIGGAVVLLLILAMGFIAAPLAILVFGHGGVSGGFSRLRRRDRTVIDA